jgi:ABC-type spermidine/putrescine transport system permease subunit I
VLEAGAGSAPGRRRFRRGPDDGSQEGGVWFPRWFWPSFAAPGLAWLLVLFVLPFYVILAVAFGTVDLFRNPLPVWQPWYWTKSYLFDVVGKIFGSQAFLRPTYYRTLVYVVVASALCLLIGYAVAYYVARHASRTKTLILVLLIAPFWISYLMRMLAWVNLLESDGYVNRTLELLHVIPKNQPIDWLVGKPITVILGLVYGYVPYMILPLYGFLDRIQSSLLEAGRDLGGSPISTFFRVTLPLSKPAIYAGLVIISLPMFGDYYTNNLLSNSPKTNMIGNLIDDAVNTQGQGPQGAVLVILLMVLLIIPMLYYMRSTLRAQEER